MVQPVRRRIAEILKEQTSATVAELAEQLGMAPVSIRHHLDVMIGEDLVAAAGVRRREGAGRPSQVYELTPAAAKLFPNRHEALAVDILSELRDALRPQEMRQVLLRIAEKTARDAPPASVQQTLNDRLDDVVQFLTEKGYNARWELADGRYEIHACNCPYSGVADHHPELCTMDQAMMQQLMPELIRLESRVLDGVPHCRYVVHADAGDTPGK